MNASSANDLLFRAVPLEHGRGLRLAGELDLASVGSLREMLAAVPGGAGGVTLDLADLSFMDSSGLHALVVYAQTLDGGGPLVLENVRGPLRRLFEITGIDQAAEIELRSAPDHG